MERLFLQLIKKKLTSLDKFPPLTYHKTLNPPLFAPPPTKTSEKLSPLFEILAFPPPLQRGMEETIN